MNEPGAGSGWIGYATGPGGKDHLSPANRAAAERLETQRNRRRGRLLCEVHVQVFERDMDDGTMYVTFPADAALGPESDQAAVAAAVARAQQKLSTWQ